MKRELLIAGGGFVLICGLLYGLSLVVAIHHVPTGSMEPTIERDSRIVVSEWGSHEDLESGEIIVFHADGNESDRLVVHRAVAYVTEGDDWVAALEGNTTDSLTCAEAVHCPAPNEGYITKGDSNPSYDQETGLSRPVEPQWITGTYWR
ncbi:S26 family signal peptidase [Natrialba taiwanensis]|uniref:Peptidase S26B, signal peptidase n=1 Tax=Natrialba taiwanensis DSM 12281 TaxID=1230458 RepID=L9ZFK1_9EURY|nr:S26 family signal peptidase [Natrialba taiwanensis]ELY85109.1 peptidase S26B, signal peptidase [Natrialba taiwanensis DSM 12281]